jgi:hypothetical protein
LVDDDGNQFLGQLIYDGPYSGILTVNNGPAGEYFSGRFTVVDQTAVQRAQGSVVVPHGNQLPAVGTVGSSASGNVNASGYWYSVGENGTKMECVLNIGLGGHGHGNCKDNNDTEYKILL